jgi:predicted nucleic acid-binding protein
VILLDAAILIAHLDPSDALHHRATGILEEYEELEFATTAITLAECLVRPAADDAAPQVVAAISRLGVLILDVTAADAVGIATVRAETGLRMPDAVALHAAELHGAVLATTDHALVRAAESRGVEVAAA